MLRKLCKKPMGWLLVIGLLLAAVPGRAQQLSSTAPTDRRAQMWAATARYVYHDDPDLQKIAGQLDQTLQKSSLPAFNAGLAKAVALEQQQLKGQKNLTTFQGMVDKLQHQQLDLSALEVSIIDKLDDKKQRMADPARKQGLKQLQDTLHLLAGAIGVAPATRPTPLPAASSVAAPPSPYVAPIPVGTADGPLTAPWMQWLALGLSALSLAGVAALWYKHGSLREAFERYRERHHQPSAVSAGPDLNSQIRREVERQMQAYTASQPAAAVAPAPSELVVPNPVPQVSAPAARLRTQYVSEAPLNRVLRAPTDQSNPYSIFAIESTDQEPNQGRFTITGNLVSHIRNHRSVLEPVCTYAGGYPLGSETRLVVEQAGQVRRTPDGNWEVTQPARVRFEA